MENKKAMRSMLIIAAIAIILDQLTKIIVRKAVATRGTIEVVKGWFNITYAENTGMAFGLLRGWNPAFIVISLIAIGFIFIYYRKFRASKWMRVSLSLLLGGAIGNLIDRIVFSHVTDFAQFRWWFIRLRWWPSFNIADSCIVIGAAILVLEMFERSEPVDRVDQSEVIESPSLEDS